MYFQWPVSRKLSRLAYIQKKAARYRHGPPFFNKEQTPTRFVTNHLQQATVLMLNKAWQAVHVKSPQEVFAMLATDVATALDIDGDSMIPVPWDKWLTLPIREGDGFVQTAKLKIRIPTVCVLTNYSRVPKRRPKLCAKSVAERDGQRCAYTGRVLTPAEGSVDHVLPRSRGGQNSWTNVVWSDKKVNAKKGNRTPDEAGLRLLKQPGTPKELPASALIRNSHGIKDWEPFLKAP